MSKSRPANDSVPADHDTHDTVLKAHVGDARHKASADLWGLFLDQFFGSAGEA